MKYSGVREEEIKNRVATDFFAKFDCDRIVGFIDFAVKLKRPVNAIDLHDEYLLWAEAKNKPTNIQLMLAQLILTIGKARTFDKIMPPPFLGCFDNEKIAFVPYSEIQGIFYQNDFNWKITPSDCETREFKQVYARIQEIPRETYLFNFEKDEKELRQFIRENFIPGKAETAKIRIDKNNFIAVYNKWLETVQPTIAVKWEKAKAHGIIDGDFYLADLLSAENRTLKEKLFVLLHGNYYEFDRTVDEDDIYNSKRAEFSDSQKAYTQFWTKYERPPLEEYWDYIIERRDLLVQQDVRERKGSFFTPKIWVELSQKYIAGVLGENWQDEYCIWDCAAGTGNLLAGLTNKYNIWASTLDKADVDVMKDRIRNGANLLESHIFQFDFLNDDFTKLPQGLQDIINDENKRKKLVIYINPPYAEIAGNKIGVNINIIHEKYAGQLEDANRELFAQFLIRIYNEIPACKIAEFSKCKTLSGSHFKTFRSNFKAKLLNMFIVPAYTFDNVVGRFPIGFKIWDTAIKEEFTEIKADVFDEYGNKLEQHGFFSYNDNEYFSRWVNSFKKKEKYCLAWLEGVTRNDFQSQNGIFICNKKEQIAVPRGIAIYDTNLLECCICFTVRKIIPADWLNDRDQFLYPNEGWKTDREFQNDCLAYTLFNNNIQSKYGVNHWIPFTEYQVAARDKFDSNFMTDFIEGKIKLNNIIAEPLLFYGINDYGGGGAAYRDKKETKLEFSEAAKKVFEAGKELWKYYHAQAKCNVNASLYDIREHFQGRNNNGKMNNKSDNETYNELIGNLRAELKILAKKIEPKVYEYGFLKE
ncbi:MAG: hypothetical protein LBL13_13210 [Bacteroidales bacterium]|jgi:hypothetical protein|nr:hypothetical protein [Bacteroidales bacterium]